MNTAALHQTLNVSLRLWRRGSVLLHVCGVAASRCIGGFIRRHTKGKVGGARAAESSVRVCVIKGLFVCVLARQDTHACVCNEQDAEQQPQQNSSRSSRKNSSNLACLNTDSTTEAMVASCGRQLRRRRLCPARANPRNPRAWRGSLPPSQQQSSPPEPRAQPP